MSASANDQEDQEDTSLGSGPPNVVFRRAMIGVHRRCNQLAELLAKQETAGAEATIRGIATLWFGGQDACARIIASNQANSPYVHAARDFLESAYMRLLDIVRQTRSTIDDAKLHSALDKIRIAVVKKMAQPATADSGQR